MAVGKCILYEQLKVVILQANNDIVKYLSKSDRCRRNVNEATVNPPPPPKNNIVILTKDKVENLSPQYKNVNVRM